MSRIRMELIIIQGEDPDRILHAEKIVDWARKHKTSAIHRHLEWNDGKAADEYRLWQARRLVAIYVVTGDGRPTVVSLVSDRNSGGGYRPLADVVARPDWHAEAVNDCLRELERIRDRYEWLKSLAPVWDGIEKVKKSATARKGRPRSEGPRAASA